MKKFIAVVCCLLLAATAYADKVKDVNIVNTPDVTVTNMPDVNVANTPDVNVANVPEVLVTNDENSPIPVTIQNGGQNGAQTTVAWRYVGLTTIEDDGQFGYSDLFGIAAMHAECASEFGPGARAATIKEALFRTRFGNDNRQGWLVPGDTPIAIIPRTTGFIARDAATGIPVGDVEISIDNAITLAYCRRYSESRTTRLGPVSDVSGMVLGKNCNVVLPAACSAPVAIPVSP